MEMSFQLKTLEPLKGALDILRLFGRSSNDTIDTDTILDELELTDRTFNKAMRRLVTKGYLQMDGDMVYRMTDNGKSLTEELLAFDEATGGVVQAPVSNKQADHPAHGVRVSRSGQRTAASPTLYRF